MDDILMHYGTPRHSGRYPWGSGENPYQHGSADFLSRVEAYEKEGLTQKQIADAMGISTGQLRARKQVAKDERDRYRIDRVKEMRDREGKTWQEIANALGYANESSARNDYKKDSSKLKNNATLATAETIAKAVEERGIIDVSKGTEEYLGCSREKLNQALYILETKGYVVDTIGVPQVSNKNQQTITKLVCPPGTIKKQMYEARDAGEIYAIENFAYTQDGGKTWNNFKPPVSIDSKRIEINYADTGGKDKDGVIELRRGVDDISLGNSSYAQVRIAVDDKYYLKGMAVYADDLPAGVDIRFNTNKTSDVPPEKVFKEMKTTATGEVDLKNPFGALTKRNKGEITDGQRMYQDSNGEWKQSAINKIRDEGDWDSWSNTLSAQMLSKQSTSLIKRQLNLSYADKVAEFDSIMKLNNPAIKRYFLEDFANDCDSSAAHLDAAALPRQKYQVILPAQSLKNNEIYAPNYKPGEKVALIRYPHGGLFEIPILTVTDKNKEAKAILGNNSRDAVAINSTVAGRLSGADFDGDTVLVIPTGGKINIKSEEPLKGLIGFEPKEKYATTAIDSGLKDENGNKIYKYINSSGKQIQVMKNTQTEMGLVSNLITDMTQKGAKEEELARAVRHSMVVIDAEKHKLDYKQSYIDNGIAALKEKYQGGPRAGAATIMSRSNSDVRIDKRKGQPVLNLKENEGRINRNGNPVPYDPNRPEGSLLFKESGETYRAVKRDKKTGEILRDLNGNVLYGPEKKRQQTVKRMSLYDDAYDLVSTRDSNGKPVYEKEQLYADYANNLKDLARRARIEAQPSKAGRLQQNASARETYKNEVASLEYKLSEAKKEAPRNRRAEIIATSIVKQQRDSNPNMTKEQEKKIRQTAISDAREALGAKSVKIDITPKEWTAIQAGAISDTKLTEILQRSDKDKLREYATPRKSKSTVSPAQESQIKALAASGFSNIEIAKRLGISASTVSKHLK